MQCALHQFDWAVDLGSCCLEQALRKLGPGMVEDTRAQGWQMVWSHVQDIAWRHLVFVRPDATSPPLALVATAGGGGVQAELSGLLALDDDSPEGFVGMDAELPRAALRKAPYVKVLAELLALRFDRALVAMESEALAPPPPGPPLAGDANVDANLEALHMALVLQSRPPSETSLDAHLQVSVCQQ